MIEKITSTAHEPEIKTETDQTLDSALTYLKQLRTQLGEGRIPDFIAHLLLHTQLSSETVLPGRKLNNVFIVYIRFICTRKALPSQGELAASLASGLSQLESHLEKIRLSAFPNQPGPVNYTEGNITQIDPAGIQYVQEHAESIMALIGDITNNLSLFRIDMAR